MILQVQCLLSGLKPASRDCEIDVPVMVHTAISGDNHDN
jgi:hypothetical protein